MGGWSEPGDGTASASDGLLRADQGALELELGDGLSPYGTVARDVDAASATAGTMSFDAAAVAATMDADDVLVVTVTPDANASEAIVTQYTGAELSSVASHFSVDVVDALPAAVLTVSFGVLNGSVGGTAPDVESFSVDNVVVELTVPDVSTYGYDSAGRLTSRSGVAGAAGYLWDATSSLVASSGAGGDRVYVYDASGQRVVQVKVTDLTGSATAVESTVYVGSVEATDAEPATVGGVSAQRFVSFGGATVAVESRTATDVTSWALMLGDVQGSAQVMVELLPGYNDAGWEDYDSNNHGVSRSAYTPFGATRADGLDINRGWLGQVEDEGTGLTYLNARYYDPATMRFISPDPLMNPGDPRTLDPYKYANNNPVAYTDATGLTAACSGLSSTNERKCLDKFNAGWKQKAPGKGGARAGGVVPTPGTVTKPPLMVEGPPIGPINLGDTDFIISYYISTDRAGGSFGLDLDSHGDDRGPSLDRDTNRYNVRLSVEYDASRQEITARLNGSCEYPETSICYPPDLDRTDFGTVNITPSSDFSALCRNYKIGCNIQSYDAYVIFHGVNAAHSDFEREHLTPPLVAGMGFTLDEDGGVEIRLSGTGYPSVTVVSYSENGGATLVLHDPQTPEQSGGAGIGLTLDRRDVYAHVG